MEFPISYRASGLTPRGLMTSSLPSWRSATAAMSPTPPPACATWEGGCFRGSFRAAFTVRRPHACGWLPRGGRCSWANHPTLHCECRTRGHHQPQMWYPTVQPGKLYSNFPGCCLRSSLLYHFPSTMVTWHIMSPICTDLQSLFPYSILLRHSPLCACWYCRGFSCPYFARLTLPSRGLTHG